MASVKDVVADLVGHAEKLSNNYGRAAAGFDRMHREAIRRIRKEIQDSDNVDAYLVALRKQLGSSYSTVREQSVFILGELMRHHPDRKEIDRSVKELSEYTKKPSYFSSIGVGREIVNALGKSGRPEAEAPLLRVLQLEDRNIVPIRQFILVALGKTGGAQTVEVLGKFMGRAD